MKKWYVFIISMMLFVTSLNAATIIGSEENRSLNNVSSKIDKTLEIQIDNKVIKFIPENNIPKNIKVFWVKDIAELKKIINEIYSLKLVHSKKNFLDNKISNTLNITNRTHFNYLFDTSEYKNRWNQTVLKVVLIGKYFYNNKKVTSINVNLESYTYRPGWEIVSMNKNYGGIGYDYAWASGEVVFRFYLGIHPIGVTIITKTLHVYDQAFIK
ncbi:MULTISPECIES: hypothetical protein [unclassified Marinitoga]|nr:MULTISPECIES: hypothetical protein [unclassified Marinitoga]KLO22999.1 hypothetical protein X274_07015 [Marinitoga sp. 1155]NUV00025.1 hypothetical protein [Marinitoga sp. 1154]